jgi:hypothetical protein
VKRPPKRAARPSNKLRLDSSEQDADVAARVMAAL